MKRKIFLLLAALTVSMVGLAQRPQAAARRAVPAAQKIQKAPQSMAGTYLNLANYSAISDWTVVNATESSVSNNKYSYNTTKGIAGEAYVTAVPNVVFSYLNTADKKNAFNIYTGQCYESGAKNALIRIFNTAAGERIIIHVAAKGTTAGSFDMAVNAIAVSSDVALPAKNTSSAGTDGYDAYGYYWKELEFISLGGTVELKETGGGFRIDWLQVTAASTAEIKNVGEAISIGTKLEVGASTDVEYTVEGYVVNAESYNPVYGSQTWWMARTKDNSNGDQFKAYLCYPTYNGERVQVRNGDWVRLTGKLSYYHEVSTDTYFTEIVRGIAEIITPTGDDHSIPSTKINVATALKYGSTLGTGKRTPISYTIMGYVSALAGTTTDYSNYGNQTFWITDDPLSTANKNSTGAFEVYRCYPNQEVKVGDFVSVQSVVYKYGSTIETETGMPATIVTPITIDCGSIYQHAYDDETPQNWYLSGDDGNYGACLDYVSNDMQSPVKDTITCAAGQFLTQYMSIYQVSSGSGGNTQVASVVDAWATVYDDNGTLKARATMIGSDDNVYAITMAQPSSTPQTIDVTCTGGGASYWDNDEAWSCYGYDGINYYRFVLPTSADKITPVGTFTKFYSASGVYANNYITQLVTFTSGTVEITKDASNHAYQIKATVQGNDGNEYNVLVTIPLYTVEVQFLPPSGVPAAGIEVLGSFGHWADAPVQLTYATDGSYRATLYDVQSDDAFKFREVGTWDNEIQYYDAAKDDWYNGKDISFANNWYDGSDTYTKGVKIDYSDDQAYRWKVQGGTPQIPTHDYTVTLYAPNVCDELPGIIGDFNEWKEPVAMTPSFDRTTFKTNYTATITMQEGKGFKIVAMPAGTWDQSGWDNQMSYYDGKDWVWLQNYYVGSETNIVLEWGDLRAYRFYQCTGTMPSKKVVIGAFLPDGIPALGAEVIGTFNNWRQSSETAVVFAPVPNMNGMYYAVVDAATAEDYFKIRQLDDDNWNEILFYDENYLDNNGEHWRTIYDEEWTFGNMWVDAEMVGTLIPTLAPYTSMVDKGILLTINDATKYKWTTIPQTINIDCGENFTWNYYPEDGDWYLELSNSDYAVKLDYYSKDINMPTGTYVPQNFMMKYTGVYQNGSAVTTIVQANATIVEKDGILSVQATLIGEDGNTYTITAAREVPTVKKQVTITATDLYYTQYSDGYVYEASNTDYEVKVTIVDLNTGTFVFGQTQMGVTIQQGNVKTTAVSGSVTVEGDRDGKYTIKGKVLCYNNVEYTLDLASFKPALGATTVRVLVPTDNNMDVKDGVFVWWWYDNKDGQCVQAQSVGGNWYEAKLNVDEDSQFNFLVVNANVGADPNLWQAQTIQQTYDVTGVTKALSCYEMSYNNFIPDGQGNPSLWTLYEVDCSNMDHNYKFTADFDDDFEGRLVIDLTTDQLAPYYELKYRLANSTDDWSYAQWTSDGYSSLSIAFNITSDTKYEYEFYAFAISSVTGYGYCVSEIKSGTVTIKANVNIPENLNSAISGDINVTFTWTPKGEDTEYYIVYVYDGNGDRIFTSDHIIGTTYTTTFYMNGEYQWILRPYDEMGNVLATPVGPNFTITNAPNLNPTNLAVKMDGRIATLTWEEPSPADKALLFVYQASPYKEEVKTILAGQNGKFSYTFTFDEFDKRTLNWSVYSLMTGHDYFYSDRIQGDAFQAETPTYTLEISAGEGGTVNDGVNGTYEENAIVTIVATPNTGYEFNKWSDQNTEATRVIKMTKDMKLIATFKKTGGGEGPATKTYTLNIASAGGGTVNEAVNGTYNENDVVTIIATPNTGWTFDKWSDNNTEATRILTMTQNYDLTASFKTTQKFNVTITAGSGGKVEPNDIKDKEYLGGSSIEITAKPNSGYTFTKWSDGNKQAKRTIVITQDTVLKALFDEVEKATLRVEILPDGEAGNVLFDDEKISPLRQEVTVGSVVKLTAKAASGYVFVHFEDGSETVTTKDYEVTVNKSKTVYAVFKKEEQGLDEIMNQESGIMKIMRDGEIYILRGDKIYTVHGQLVK